MTKTMTKTFRERPQRVILETYDLWDIWSERWGDMTWPTKQAMTKTNSMTKTKTKTITNTFRKHPQRATPETCDLWDIWSEWWGDRTWPKKRQWQRQIQRKRQWQRQIHLESTVKEQSQRLVTFKTFDQSDEETWPDQKKTMTKTKTNTKTKTKTNTFREHLQKAILETFDHWDIWSEWWGDIAWPTKRRLQRQIQR